MCRGRLTDAPLAEPLSGPPHAIDGGVRLSNGEGPRPAALHPRSFDRHVCRPRMPHLLHPEDVSGKDASGKAAEGERVEWRKSRI